MIRSLAFSDKGSQGSKKAMTSPGAVWSGPFSGVPLILAHFCVGGFGTSLCGMYERFAGVA